MAINDQEYATKDSPVAKHFWIKFATIEDFQMAHCKSTFLLHCTIITIILITSDIAIYLRTNFKDKIIHCSAHFHAEQMMLCILFVRLLCETISNHCIILRRKYVTKKEMIHLFNYETDSTLPASDSFVLTVMIDNYIKLILMKNVFSIIVFQKDRKMYTTMFMSILRENPI